MRRTSRRVIAVLALFSVLFSQGLVAAHACTEAFDPMGGPVVASGIGSHAHDCAGMMEKAATALCLKHCTHGSESNNAVAPVDIPTAVLNAFLVVEPATYAATTGFGAWSRPAANRTSPPPLVLSQRLRI